jgi:uncharacterized protein
LKKIHHFLKLGNAMSNGIPKHILKAGGTQKMLQKELYVISTKLAPGVSLEEMREVVPEHLIFQVDLEARGIMFGAGPLFPPDSENWQGEGLVIIRAKSLEEAKSIAASDPMHIAGKRVFSVREWMMNEGSITVRVSYSDGKSTII